MKSKSNHGYEKIKKKEKGAIKTFFKEDINQTQ